MLVFQTRGREDILCEEAGMEPLRVPFYQRTASASPWKGECDFTEGLPGSPTDSIITCWSPLLVFSVALTGFGILHKANEAVIKVFVTLSYLHVSAAVWGQLISSLTQKESF